MKQSDWLRYYAQHFGSVEINNSFYRLPENRIFKKWDDTSPENFTFAVKTSLFLTHMKKLASPDLHSILACLFL
jgi:uncharacterized protein YecE (DUF72 family)